MCPTLAKKSGMSGQRISVGSDIVVLVLGYC